MLLEGYRFKNLPECLVNVRAGREMYKRRGGLKYAYSEVMLQKWFRDIGFIDNLRFLKNVSIRGFSRVVPNFARSLIYGLVRKVEFK
jgi:hypothetical protein